MVHLEEPDKGYAWIVALSAFGINFILAGLSRSIGIIYVHILEYFRVQRSEATLPFSIRNVVRCLSGPLVGIVGHRLGARTVTVFGGLIAAIGVALCRVAPDIIWLTVFWGGIHGIGFALANTLFQVVVNQYFEKHRSTASGIALSGSCVGSLVLPFILDPLFDEYNFQGTFLILGAIALHVMPLGLLLRAPQWVMYPKQYAKLKARQEAIQRGEELTPAALSAIVPKKLEVKLSHKTSIVGATTLANNPVEQLEILSFPNRQPNIRLSRSLENVSHNATEEEVADDDTNRCMSAPSIISKSNSDTSADSPEQQSVTPMLARILEDGLPSSSSSLSKEKNCLEDFKTMIWLYTNPMFVVVSVGMSVYQLIFIIVLSVLVDYGVDKGMSGTNGKYLINGMSIGDLIGRLCFGWVTDRGYLSLANFSMCLFILQGVSLTLFPTTDAFLGYMSFLFIFGMTSGGIIVLFPVTVYKYVPRHVQTLGIGAVAFMSGIVSLTIPVIIGHFRDYLGSYDKMFYLLGGISIATGVLYLFEPIAVKCYYSKESVRRIMSGSSENH